MRQRLLIVSSVVALVLSGAPPAFAQAFDPHDFEVELQGGPEMNPPEPTCTQDPDGTVTCSQAFDFEASGQRMSGTVRSLSKGLSGTIETTCDMSQRMRQTMRSTPAGATEVLEFTGSGSQSCAWFMDFGEETTLAGTIAGRMEMGLASATEAYFGGTFSVVVVSGTGAFGGTIGTGVFNEREVFPLPTGGPPSVERAGSPALAAADSSGMNLKLRSGKPLARVVSPGRRLKRSSSAVLRVVSAPGSSCRASARNGNRLVDFGRAKDGDGDGVIAFSGRVASKLKRGAWILTARCAYEVGKLRGTATARAPVRLAAAVAPGSLPGFVPNDGTEGGGSPLGGAIGLVLLAGALLSLAVIVGAGLIRRHTDRA